MNFWLGFFLTYCLIFKVLLSFDFIHINISFILCQHFFCFIFILFSIFFISLKDKY